MGFYVAMIPAALACRMLTQRQVRRYMAREAKRTGLYVDR